MQRSVCTVTRAAPQHRPILLDGFTGRGTRNGHPWEHLQPLLVGRGPSPSGTRFTDQKVGEIPRSMGSLQALLFLTHFLLFACFIYLLLSPRLDTLHVRWGMRKGNNPPQLVYRLFISLSWNLTWAPVWGCDLLRWWLFRPWNWLAAPGLPDCAHGYELGAGYSCVWESGGTG